MDPPLETSTQKVIDHYESEFVYCKENEVNLLEAYPNSTKSRATRIEAMRPSSLNTVSDLVIKEKLISEARNYGKEYFDGNRLYGYGGYYYNSKFWAAVAKDFVKHFSITDTSSILEIGCAKGFFLYELQTLVPSLCLNGIDISSYAINLHIHH